MGGTIRNTSDQRAILAVCTYLIAAPMAQSIACMLNQLLGFFSTNSRLYDIIFIDGDHCAHQVRQDVLNSLETLALGGIILLHDVFPDREHLVDDRYCCDGFRSCTLGFVQPL